MTEINIYSQFPNKEKVHLLTLGDAHLEAVKVAKNYPHTWRTPKYLDRFYKHFPALTIPSTFDVCLGDVSALEQQGIFDCIANEIMKDTIASLICEHYLVFEVKFDLSEIFGKQCILEFNISSNRIIFEKEKNILPNNYSFLGQRVNDIIKHNEHSAWAVMHSLIDLLY